MSQLPLIANLPWYDFPELMPATDALWSAVAQELSKLGIEGVPRALNREMPYVETWHSSRLLMGQACGYDLVISAREHLQYVATPCYTAPCSRGPTYRSYIIVRASDPWNSLEDLRGLRCVINQRTSHSGMNALRCELAPKSVQGHYFSEVLESGAHRKSLQSLRAGQADVAAVDCVAYALLKHNLPEELAGLRVIHRTLRVPAPPFVTSKSTPRALVTQLQAALRAALARTDLEVAKESLMLGSIEVLESSAYGIIKQQKDSADQAGYSELLSPPEL